MGGRGGVVRRSILWTMLTLLSLSALAALVIGISGIGSGDAELDAGAAAPGLAEGGAPAEFARALEPRELRFPQDHGPHLEYQTEWWYYTGNLQTADGRHFGFQRTFLRRGLPPGGA